MNNTISTVFLWQDCEAMARQLKLQIVFSGTLDLPKMKYKLLPIEREKETEKPIITTESLEFLAGWPRGTIEERNRK